MFNLYVASFMKHFRILIPFLLAFVILFASCRNTPKNQLSNEEKQRIENLNIKISRFEKDLFAVKIDSIAAYLPKLEKKYGEFFSIYNYKVIQLGSIKNPEYPDELKRFITDYYMNLDYQKVMEVYPDISDIEQGLTKAFKNYLTYFPTGKVPSVITCISGWNQSVVTTDTILGIALDKFLGRNCDFYTKLGLSEYMKYTMQRQYIVPVCMRAWANAEFSSPDSASNVLGKMLFEGKLFYIEKKILPETNDSIIFGFTPKQLEWCSGNEKQMWTYLIENKLLYSTDFLTIVKLTGPAPFTSYFTSESPGQAALWLGYRIIDSYMSHNSEVTLPELMHDTDYQAILRKSAYQP